MADVVIWQAEEIPDEQRTYLRAHAQYFRSGFLQPGVFKPHGGGMSVDWDKYSTPDETRQRGRDPSKNAVVSLIVEGIRDIEPLDVKHTPDHSSNPPNRAHSDVIGFPDGETLTEVRIKLLDVSSIVIGF